MWKGLLRLPIVLGLMNSTFSFSSIIVSMSVYATHLPLPLMILKCVCIVNLTLDQKVM
jgi:hypothetical protein